MKNTMKKPVSGGGVAKVPVVMQLEVVECGAACLDMVLGYYGKWVALEQVRLDCGVSRDGSNAKNILMAARNYGLVAKAFRLEPERLKEIGVFPCIIHWEFNHFVVLDGFKNGKAKLNDPARGEVYVSMKEFDEAFTGIAIMMEPGENFVSDGRKKSVLSFATQKLKGTGSAILFTILTTVIISLIGMISPAFSRVFLDYLMGGNNPDWVYPFLGLFAAFILLQTIVMLLQNIYSLKIEGKLSVVANSNYMWHVLLLPMEFFSQRLSGDIAMRKTENESIASELIQTLAPIALNIIMLVFYLIVMLRYSVILACIGLGGMAINALLEMWINKKRIGIMRIQMRDEGKLVATTISGIEMMETIKASGAENGFFEKWSGYQASVNAQNVKSSRLSLQMGMLPTIVSTFVDMSILGVGLYLVIQGQLTVGLLFAFQALLVSFMEPANEMVKVGETMQSMTNSMERIQDVMEYPIASTFQEREEEEISDYAKLSGNIEMRNVTFGYSKLANPLIEGFNMTIKPGQKIAFVGGSGCGKSTLAKLLSGLYDPWEGEILFDGKPIASINRNIFTGSLAVVDQDVILFEDSIANNIKMWDSSIEDFEMILAARDASLHEDILQRDGGYNYKVLEGGKDFSGGQCQRMEIARVLAQDPTIIIMDEATSALDARTEYEVVKAIKDRGITSIVIAHRLSTVRDADLIIVLDNGKVVEQGTHEELMSIHGKYEELIMSE